MHDEEEIRALASIFGQSKQIDSMTLENHGTAHNSDVMRREIENFARSSRGQHPSQMHSQPIPQQQAPVHQPQPPIAPVHPPQQMEDTGQLEFNFKQDELQETNKHLKEISIKLTKILDVLKTDNENKSTKEKF